MYSYNIYKIFILLFILAIFLEIANYSKLLRTSTSWVSVSRWTCS